MNIMECRRALFCAVFAVAMGVFAPHAAAQVDATPGLTNPVEFETYDPLYFWSGQVGTKEEYFYPDAITGETGSCFGDSCVYMTTDWSGNPRRDVVRPKLPGMHYGDDLDTLQRVYNMNYASFDGDSSLLMEPKKHFRIMYNTDTKTPDNPNSIGMDPYTQYRLSYCPPGFTSSIRIGNAGGGGESDALYYTMQVTPQNALLLIYYACVIEVPSDNNWTGHGPKPDPIFIIRVMEERKDDDGNPMTDEHGNKLWDQISDTMCYMQPSTGCGNQYLEGRPCVDTSNHEAGWHKNDLPGGSSSWSSYKTFWKEWSKVAVSLNNYLHKNVRIEVIVGDCSYSQHYGYAYIAGMSQPMALKGSGCPVGESTAVDTLTAPAGLSNYIFYKQVNVVTGVNDNPEANALSMKLLDSTGYQTIRTKDGNGTIYNWERIPRSEVTNSNNRFALEQGDFEQPDGSYVGSMNFMCKMRSFMDPSKAITSMVFTNVQYKKPLAIIEQEPTCDKTIKLVNKSKSYSSTTTLQPEATYWVLYEDPECTVSTGDTTWASEMTGDTAVLQFEHGGTNGVSLYVKTMNTATDTALCYTVTKMKLEVLEEPRTRLQIVPKELCDGQQAELKDMTYPNNEDSVYRRIWRYEGIDTLVFERYSYDSIFDEETGDFVRIDTTDNIIADHMVTRREAFTRSVVPVELDVYNGYYYVVEGDTTWCHKVARDTVRVFLNPEIRVDGDSVVCEGTRTDLEAVSENPDYTFEYQWSTDSGYVSGSLPAGPYLRVAPSYDTTRYFVKVKNDKGCVAWKGFNTFLVKPQINIIPGIGRGANGEICPGETATLFGSKADHYTWSSSPVDPSLGGQETLDTIRVTPEKTTRYTMVGHGSNDCNATPKSKDIIIVPLPVPTVQTSPSIIDSEDPTVTFRDVSPGSVSTIWNMGDGSEPISGSEVTYTFEETYDDTVYVTMTAFNKLGCFDSTTIPMPVVQFTAWTPNIFTPALETNNRFSLYTINDYEYFTVYIYDRRGRLIYESDDAKFEWDGRDMNGTECPQGAYVWIMRYRRPGTSDIVTRKGSVTILR